MDGLIENGIKVSISEMTQLTQPISQSNIILLCAQKLTRELANFVCRT